MELQQEIIQLAGKLGRILTDNRLWITTAESCTGGGISYALTETPGSSHYLDRAFITYSNQAKHELLAVKLDTLQKSGAVSKLTVIEMAQGALAAGKADVAISVSGIAGPGGGSTEKPVGTVWFAINYSGEIHAFEQVFSGERSEVRLQAIVFALKNTIDIINK